MEETNRPAQWPIGARLRFKANADLADQYLHLAGTPVVVMGDLRWRPSPDGVRPPAWRQEVLAFAYSVSKTGWAKPSQLEPIPDDPLDPLKELAESEDDDCQVAWAETA